MSGPASDFGLMDGAPRSSVGRTAGAEALGLGGSWARAECAQCPRSPGRGGSGDTPCLGQSACRHFLNHQTENTLACGPCGICHSDCSGQARAAADSVWTRGHEGACFQGRGVAGLGSCSMLTLALRGRECPLGSLLLLFHEVGTSPRCRESTSHPPFLRPSYCVKGF